MEQSNLVLDCKLLIRIQGTRNATSVVNKLPASATSWAGNKSQSHPNHNRLGVPSPPPLPDAPRQTPASIPTRNLPFSPAQFQSCLLKMLCCGYCPRGTERATPETPGPHAGIAMNKVSPSHPVWLLPAQTSAQPCQHGHPERPGSGGSRGPSSPHPAPQSNLHCLLLDKFKPLLHPSLPDSHLGDSGDF